MTAQEYILSTVEALSEPLALESVGKEVLEDTIYSKVMSKKFRKLKAGESAVKLSKEAIRLAVKENKPITIFEMFGGNKLWRFDEAPEVDWAELFSMTYFAQWARLIASVYEPGVEFIYFSQDISVESLNNVPRSETDKYSQTMRELIKWMQPHLPPNLKFTYLRHYDLFKNPDDYYKELEQAKEAILKESGGKLPTMTDGMKAATELNVKLKPGQDKDPQWREKIELQHQAIFRTKTLGKRMSDPHNLWACPTYYPDNVVTGSTKHSIAKFWAGIGALHPNENSFYEVVLTPKQLSEATYGWQPVDIKGLPGKNFSRVRILK
jgi:hypothetical protein